jgi:hypothetical protein
VRDSYGHHCTYCGAEGRLPQFRDCVSTKKSEPLITHATVRVSDSEEWIDIECRMEDGQKGAFIQVDASFPQLAMAIAHYLTHEQEKS